MNLLHSIAIVAASLGLAGQLGDAVTSYMCFSKGATEANTFLGMNHWPHAALYIFKFLVGAVPLALVLSGNGYAADAGLAAGIAACIVGVEQTKSNLAMYKGLK